MEFTRRTITLHGGRELYILSPNTAICGIASGHDHKGNALIWGNGTGYQFLSQCFAISAELKNNEILYIPIRFEAVEQLRQAFGDCVYNLNIICTNYCDTQISPKDIERALGVKTFEERTIHRSAVVSKDYVESWKTERRLTVKTHKKNMCITTNRDVFSALARGAQKMQAYGDDYHNDFSPHTHFDWDENTSVSLGVTLYYWSANNHK